MENNDIVTENEDNVNNIKKYALVEHEVQNEDTIQKLALKYGSSVGEISAINKLSGQLLFPSQKLFIPVRKHLNANICDSVFIEVPEPESPLIPVHVKHLKFFPPEDPDTEHFISDSPCLLDLEASLIVHLKRLEKKVVKMTFGEKKLTTRFKSNMSSSPSIFSKEIDISSLDSAYNFKYKDIKSFRFFESLDSLKNHEEDLSKSSPIQVIEDFEVRKKSRRKSPNKKNKLKSNEECAYPNLFNKNNMNFEYIESPGRENKTLDERNFTRNENGLIPVFIGRVKKFKRFLTPTKNKRIPLENCPVWPKYNECINDLKTTFSKFATRKSASSLDFLTENYDGLPKPKIVKQLSMDDNKYFNREDRFLVLCIDFKNYINEENLNFFRDFPHLYDFQSPKLILEINSTHMEFILDFISQCLNFKKNIKNDDSIDEEKNIYSKISNDVNLEEFYNDSLILSRNQIDIIAAKLPSSVISKTAKLAYSTWFHGTSMKTLYRNMLKYKDSPTIFVILDDSDCMFGAILSSLPKISNTFYGSGECALFKEDKSFNDIKFFTWTHNNNYFIKGDQSYFAVGCGKNGYGLWINEDLLSGYSRPCETFDNETLSSCPDFKLNSIEIWAFE